MTVEQSDKLQRATWEIYDRKPLSYDSSNEAASFQHTLQYEYGSNNTSFIVKNVTQLKLKPSGTFFYKGYRNSFVHSDVK